MMANSKSKKSYYDLSVTISENLATFPGDPCYQVEQLSALEEGGRFHLNKIFLGNHTGTHIDFPSHFIKYITVCYQRMCLLLKA